MKKILFNLMAGVTLFTLASCEPVTDVVSETTGGTISDASQLQATVSEPTGATYKSTVKVSCSSPVVCQWTDGYNTLSSNEGSFTFIFAGEQKLSLTALTPDGKKLSKEFMVTVPSAETPWYYTAMFGTAESGYVKEWEWNHTGDAGWPAPDGGPKGPFIMCGGAPSSGRDYWGWTPDDFSKDPNQGYGAKMRFTLAGKKLTKIGVDGSTIGEGTIAFDMTPNAIYSSVGTITFNGANVLYPYDYNGGIDIGTNKFTIVYLDNDHLMLFTPSANGGWYLVFNAVN